jgi:hypothetical protein
LPEQLPDIGRSGPGSADFRHEETDYTWAGRRGPLFAGSHANSPDRLVALAFDDRLTRSRPMSAGGRASHT